MGWAVCAGAAERQGFVGVSMGVAAWIEQARRSQAPDYFPKDKPRHHAHEKGRRRGCDPRRGERLSH